MDEAIRDTRNGATNPSLEGAALELAAMNMHGLNFTTEPTQVQRKALEVVNLVMDSRHGNTNTPTAIDRTATPCSCCNSEEGAHTATRKSTKLPALVDSPFAHELLEVYKQQVNDQRFTIDHMDREHITRADLKKQVDNLRELLQADQAAIEKINGELLVSRAQATFHADKIVHLSQRIRKEIASERNQMYLEQAAHVEKDSQDRMAQNDAWEQDIESKVDRRVDIAERLAVLSNKIHQLNGDTRHYEQPQNNCLISEDETHSNVSCWSGGDVDDDGVSEDALEHIGSRDGDDNESHMSYNSNQGWCISKARPAYPYQAYVEEENNHDQNSQAEHQENEPSEDDAHSRASTIEAEVEHAAEKRSHFDWRRMHYSCWDCGANTLCCHHYKGALKISCVCGWAREKGDLWCACMPAIDCVCGHGCTVTSVRDHHGEDEYRNEYDEQDQHRDNNEGSDRACSPAVSNWGHCDPPVDAARSWGICSNAGRSSSFGYKAPSNLDEECDKHEYKVGDYHDGKRVLAIDAMGNLVCDHEPEKDWDAMPRFFMGAELASDFLPRAYHIYSEIVDDQMEEWYEDDETQFTYIDSGPWRGLIINGEHRGKYAFGLEPPTDEQIAEALGEDNPDREVEDASVHLEGARSGSPDYSGCFGQSSFVCDWDQTSVDKVDVTKDEPQFWLGRELVEENGLPQAFHEFSQSYEVVYATKDEAPGSNSFTYVSNGPWSGLIIDGEHRGKYVFRFSPPSDECIADYQACNSMRRGSPVSNFRDGCGGLCSHDTVDQRNESENENDEVSHASASPTGDRYDEDEYRRQFQEQEAEIDELKYRLQGDQVEVVAQAEILAAKEAEIQALTVELQQARAALSTMPNDRGVQTSSTFGQNSPASIPIYTPASSQLSDDSSFDKISMVMDEPQQWNGAGKSAWANIADECPEYPEYPPKPKSSTWW
ncbi:hypothetical protein PG995_013776 [Apiospora arundinis]